MKILFTADPGIPVPPVLYGGIERIIDMLIRELTLRGHEILLLAHKDSQTSAKLFPYPGINPQSPLDTIRNGITLLHALSHRPDVIHSFGRLAYLMPALPLNVPKIMSYQREPTESTISQAVRLAKKGTLQFTGCSEYIAGKIRKLAPSTAIFNGVPTQNFHFNPSVPADAPLVFLGRIEPIKGPQHAVRLALATNRKLIIAGNIPPEYQSWVEKEILAFADGDQITYIGPVNDQQKSDLLSQAAAFLMLIDWNEPFGIVMAEALACGTPIIGYPRGAVPEVVSNGYNGFICNTFDESCLAVERISEISRFDCRSDAETRFSQSSITDQYVSLYEQMVK